jgi:hypothetical protein
MEEMGANRFEQTTENGTPPMTTFFIQPNCDRCGAPLTSRIKQSIGLLA